MRFSSLLAPTPGHEAGTDLRPTARPCPADAPRRTAETEPLATAEALDQRTLWPVHRIRWFLLSQPTLTGTKKDGQRALADQ